MRVPAAALMGMAAMMLTAADAPSRPDRNDPDAVRCKRLAVTGSLVRKERTCRTNAEWKRISEQQNRDADDLMTRSRAGMDCRAGGGC
jgi:hypothetical protein